MTAARPDRTGTDDGDDIACFDPAVLHADLVSGRQDVTEEHGRLESEPFREPVQRRLRERHSHELRLSTVDEVPEDPADPPMRLRSQGSATADRRRRIRTFRRH